MIFADFLEKTNTFYSQATDTKLLSQMIELALEEYNQIHKTGLNLIFFKYSIQHICRINRILKMTRSHGLLIGSEGSGRQSLTRLAVHIADYYLYEVSHE